MGGWFRSPPWHGSPPWATQALAPVWMTSSLAEGKKDVFPGYFPAHLPGAPWPPGLPPRIRIHPPPASPQLVPRVGLPRSRGLSWLPSASPTPGQPSWSQSPLSLCRAEQQVLGMDMLSSSRSHTGSKDLAPGSAVSLTGQEESCCLSSSTPSQPRGSVWALATLTSAWRTAGNPRRYFPSKLAGLHRHGSSSGGGACPGYRCGPPHSWTHLHPGPGVWLGAGIRGAGRTRVRQQGPPASPT